MDNFTRNAFIGIGICVFVFIVLAASLGSLKTTTTASTVDTVSQTNETQYICQLDTFCVPNTWTTHTIAENAFSISVPEFVEIQTISPVQTPCDIIFQQKGLNKARKNKNIQEMDKHYCRIMLLHEHLDEETLSAYETEELNWEWYVLIRDIVDAELGHNQTLLPPAMRYQWIALANETKAIEIKYRRSGNNNQATACTIYLLFNRYEIVKMIVSCRDSENAHWRESLEHVVQTFQWTNKY